MQQAAIAELADGAADPMDVLLPLPVGAANTYTALKVCNAFTFPLFSYELAISAGTRAMLHREPFIDPVRAGR